MELSLKYNEHATHSLSGAFIRGNSPDGWLQEMNAWQIPLESLVCFIISKDNNPLEAAGLFVIFKKEQLPGLFQVRHPYTVLGNKLFIPVDAELSPAISEAELQKLLIWDYQVFHPTIGFIGFEKTDRIALADLLQYTAPEPVSWGYAQPGQQPWIPLHQVGIQQLTPEELFESIKDTISSKPLTEVPKSSGKETPGWLNNRLAEGLFKSAYVLLSGLGALLPKGMFAGNNSNGGKNVNRGEENGKSGSGWFNRIINWMEEKIEDLEKQRDSELKRLSDLFEKNSDEALQYAIPLNSPYLNRGTAASPSARLTKRPLQFNLGRLGGGQAVDGWNVDNYYNDLRNKYLKAAQQAIEQKDFKKAAYVYAHLLGDYSQAAITLRQGKHFREAAVLYKEHLKNLPLAAACLEEGGLYVEAIELYTELNQHEKAGDLYMLLDRKEPALECFEKCVEWAALNKDYLEESRIIIDKIGDRPRAKKILLNGWQDVKQSEACLLKYFDLVAGDNNDNLHTAVKSFYTDNIPDNKELSFLNVIDKVNRKYRTPELENTCKDIAYEVVSEQVNAGNAASLHTLKNFVPEDQLLTPDCYRFIHTFKNVPRQKPKASELQLIKDVVWQKAIYWQSQLLVWGIKSSGLVLARINPDRHVEYYTWNESLQWYSIIPMADDDNSIHILAFNEYVAFAEKRLPGNKYFEDELIVSGANFLPGDLVGICMANGTIITLHNGHEESFLSTYSLQGELLRSVRCLYDGNKYQMPTVNVNEMVYCDKVFYVACDDLLVRIAEDGVVEVLYYGQARFQKIAVNKRHDGFITIAFADANSVSFYTRNAEDNISDPFVVNEIIPMDMIVLPQDRFAVADKQKVQVFDFFDFLSPKIYWEVETENDVVAVFQGSSRDQLGILDANGLITWHNIRESA